MARTKPQSPPLPAVSADEQARLDRVAECRALVERYKRDGVEPRVLALAVEDLQAALAAAPDLPPPPPASVGEPEESIDLSADAPGTAGEEN